MARKTWAIHYRGWRITHDPLGKLACYRLEGRTLAWHYPSNSVKGIKAAIDQREDFIDQMMEQLNAD